MLLRLFGSIQFFLLAILLACPSMPGQIPPDPTVPGALGVNIHFTDPQPGELSMLAATGVRWVRMDFSWAATEKERGVYDFSAYDRLLATLDRHHLCAILILDYGNKLYDGGGPPRSDEAIDAFARWAAAGVRHFRGRGIAWEMWNEPNYYRFWPPQADTSQYIRLSLATAESVVESEPSEILIGPASSLVSLDFIEPCLRAGLLNYWQAISVHPYRMRIPESVASDYSKLKDLIRRYAPPGKKVAIISGEWGYSAAMKWNQMDERKQAMFLAREMLTNIANGVAISIWYDWRNDGASSQDIEMNFGLVRNQFNAGQNPPFQPKPAYWAMKTLTSELAGCRFARVIPAAGTNGDQVLAFSSGSGERYAAWTTSETPHRTFIPLPRARYHVTAELGQSQKSLKSGKKGLRITLSGEPVYLTPAGR